MSTPADTPREFEAIGNAIRQNKVALFLGAGVSKQAGYPLFDDLVAEMLERFLKDLAGGVAPEIRVSLQASVDSDDPERWQAVIQHIQGKWHRSQFAEAVRELLTGKDPSALHKTLGQIPWPLIVTTNFDTLIEQTYAGHEPPQELVPLTCRTVNKAISIAPPILLKLHGDVNDPREMIFSLESYFRSLNDPATQNTLRNIMARKSFLFVGYSLRDVAPDCRPRRITFR